jgi:hypothetical protein
MKALATGFALLVLAVAGGTAPGAAPAADSRPDAVVQWDYRVLSREQVLDLGKKDLAAGLNQLGDDGWELVVAEPAFIFKRPRDQARKQAAEVKRRLALLESDVEMLKDRVAWSERMLRKGYMTEQQANAERLRLEAAQISLDEARKQLKDLPSNPKGPAGPERKPDQ